MKWACCGVSPREKWRFEQLQAALGSSHELAFFDWNPEGDWEKELQGFSHVRWGEAVQVEVTKAMKVHSTWTALIGIADGAVFRDGRWWPLCGAYEALGQTVTGIGEGLDMQASAFVSGTGAMARAGVGALFRSGYRRFRIAARSAELAEPLAKDVRLKFFGIDLEVVPPDKIVLLGGVSSIFLNTLSEEEAPELVQEISYLNFLKRPGAIIDSTLPTKQTMLLKEAVDSAIPTVDGWDLAARIDTVWAEWAFSHKLDSVSYGKNLKEGSAKLA